MITDRIQIAGPAAYLANPSTGRLNLADATNGVVARSEPLAPGKTLEVSALQLLLVADDLERLFTAADDSGVVRAPILGVRVMKELVPGLFAPPFASRLHNVAGFEDFNRGVLTNAQAMDIDGIPTIVSVGSSDCSWTSSRYDLPEPITVASAGWELATSRRTPASAFAYSLRVRCFDRAGGQLPDIVLASSANPTTSRKADRLQSPGVSSFEVSFAAEVNQDSTIYEHHGQMLGESLGRPLLRAVNLVESVESVFEFRSLGEILGAAADYEFADGAANPHSILHVVLDIRAVLTSSDNQVIANGDRYDPGSVYEYIEVFVAPGLFNGVEARLMADVQTRVRT